MGSTIVYRGCDQSLEGVDPSRIHGMGSTLVDNLKGIDSRIHRMGSTLVYKSRGESLKGCRPFKDSAHGFYTNLQGMRCTLGGCRPLQDSPHGFYTSLQMM